MRAEHLKRWPAEAQKEEEAAAKSVEGTDVSIGGPRGEETEGGRETDNKKEMRHWEKVVELARAYFGERRLGEEAMWQAVVLIPKEKRGYRGIGLVELV